MLRKLRKRYGHLLGLSRVSQRVRPIATIVDRSTIERRDATPSTYLAVAAIMKNEAPYLREWLEFHRLVGVERFLLYDNDSSDETREVVAPYVRNGIVELVPWPNFLAGGNAQHLAYTHAVAHLAGRVNWLAVIDIDEFLFSPVADSVASVFRKYDDLPALIIFERFFGPHGHEKPPDGLVIENYLTRLEDTQAENRMYKSAIQPHLARSIVSAHRFHQIADKTHGYDENRNAMISVDRCEHTSSKLRVNHYATRSLQEFDEKVARRYFGLEKNVERRRQEKIEQHSKLVHCDVEDRDILRFVPALRERLARPVDEIAP